MRMGWIIFKNRNALFRHCSGTLNIRWAREASGRTILFY
jgi:hypothetical protein